MRARKPDSTTWGISRRARRADPGAGFTLVEVTLALTLVGLLAALSLPRVLPDATSTALRLKTFEVAALLRADRNAALRTGQTTATEVDLAARRVRSGASGRWIVLPDSVAVRLTTDLAIPGWATTAFGVLLIILLQATMFLVVFSFMILAGRNAAGFLPLRDYAYFVGSERVAYLR